MKQNGLKFQKKLPADSDTGQFLHTFFLFEWFISLYSHWHCVSPFWDYSKWQKKTSFKTSFKTSLKTSFQITWSKFQLHNEIICWLFCKRSYHLSYSIKAKQRPTICVHVEKYDTTYLTLNHFYIKISKLFYIKVFLNLKFHNWSNVSRYWISIWHCN